MVTESGKVIPMTADALIVCRFMLSASSIDTNSLSGALRIWTACKRVMAASMSPNGVWTRHCSIVCAMCVRPLDMRLSPSPCGVWGCFALVAYPGFEPGLYAF